MTLHAVIHDCPKNNIIPRVLLDLIKKDNYLHQKGVIPGWMLLRCRQRMVVSSPIQE